MCVSSELLTLYQQKNMSTSRFQVQEMIQMIGLIFSWVWFLKVLPEKGVQGSTKGAQAH